MRFLSFTTPQGKSGVGVLLEQKQQVVDLTHAAYRSIFSEPPTMLSMLESGLSGVIAKIDAATVDPASLLPLDSVTVLAPIPVPGKIIGAAHNYVDALAERGAAHPPEPITFFRSGRATIGPGAAILIPPDVGDVGYEGELAVVIGRRAIDVKRADAMSCIAGYTVHNDVSGSAMTKADGGRFVRGKNMPATSPLGPYLVSADEVPDPHSIGITLEIDGRKLQNGSTASMLHDIPTLIEYISHRMPLEPGDIIATGTPAGVAAMHTPTAWLLPGQTVTIELTGIGRLVNPVRAGVPYLANL